MPASILDLLGLPDPDGLHDAQLHGRDCVWCNRGPVTVEASVDYGEQTNPASGATTPQRWYPRACRPCIGQRAYSAFLDHAPSCKTGCEDTPLGCDIGRILNRLIREGRRAARR
ncbi:hypothetical protein ACFVAF_25015 [Streptomyces sp. NPDC057596]|uniref:hypothetical protein n=1 Tax=Streptomyces sp. NPDC057596 TaxID=3346178 RepID=UPI003676C267